MKALDYLSLSPTYYIFQQKINKTKFGGVLFLIYLILMFLFSLTYILDFILNDKFEILVSTVYIYKKRDKNRNNWVIVDPNLNQTENVVAVLNFSASSQNQIDEIINKTFLFDLFAKKYVKGYLCPKDICHNKNESIYSLIFNFTISIIKEPIFYLDFNCSDSICSNYPNNSFIHFSIITRDFEINHNESNPIITHDCIIENNFCEHHISSRLYDYQTIGFNLKISSIIYKERQGISRFFDKIFDIKNNYSISSIEKSESEKSYLTKKNDSVYDYNIIYDKTKKLLVRYFSRIKVKAANNYQIYLRSKISFLDVIAKLGALFSTFYSIFSFIVMFYSKNFDNYKIVERLLQNNKLSQNKITFNKNKINSENMNSFSPLVINNDSENEEEEENENEINNNLNNIEKEEKNTGKNENKILPKFSFFDFYFNNIYCKCCKRRERQDMLNICNKIIANYVSIDSVINNMIKLENLIKDYKWNNPGKNNLDSNELISEINKYLYHVI